MRRILFISLLLAQLECKKDDSSQHYTFSFGFKANGADFGWSFNSAGSNTEGGALINRFPGSGGSPSGYLLQGFGPSRHVTLNCFMETNSFTTAVYKTVTTASTGFIQSSYIINGVNYAPINLNDSMVVTISNVLNNLASGTFTAVMHDIATRSEKVEIKDGYFNNVIVGN